MSATPNINLLKIQGNKFDATAAPTVNDDTSTGFSVGSTWIDVTNDKAYNCVDATTGAAVWNEAGGGGGNTIYTANDTLTGNRTISLSTYTLSFDGNTGGSIATNFNGRTAFISNRTNGEANILEIQDNSNNRIFEVRENNSVHINAQGTGDVVLGANAQIGTEKISLQGNTLVKGSDNSASTSGFKIVDTNGDSKWDFRNNGDVNLGADSVITLNNTLKIESGQTYIDSGGFNPLVINRKGSGALGNGIDFNAYNSSNAETNFARIVQVATDTTAGSEDGGLWLRTMIGGTLTTPVILDNREFLIDAANFTDNGFRVKDGTTDCLKVTTSKQTYIESTGFNPLVINRKASGVQGIGIDFNAYNSSNAETNFARIVQVATDTTAGSEDGGLLLRVSDNGSISTKVTVNTGGIVVAGNTISESTSSNAAFIANGDGSSQDGYIQLNCWNNNHGIKLKSPPHSAAASYTLTFPNDTGSNGQFLKTNGSGVLSWGAAGGASPLTTKGDLYTRSASADTRLPVGANGQALVADSTEATGLKYVNLSETPAVGGGLLVDLGFPAANQVITVANNATTINFDDTVTGAVDKNGDWNNTSKKFIVSSTSGAGTYQFEVNLFCQNSTGAYYNLQAWIGGVLKTPNGAFAMSDAIDDSGFDGASGTLSLDLDVGDEVEIKLQALGSASTTVLGIGTWAFTQGMRVSKTSGIKGEKGDTGTGAPVSLSKTFTLQEPTASDNITMFRTDVAITIQEVVVVHTGTNTPGTTITIRHEPDRSATGNSLTNGSLASSNTTTGVVYTVANGSLSDVTIPADSFVWLVTSAASGTDVYLSVDIRYTED